MAPVAPVTPVAPVAPVTPVAPVIPLQKQLPIGLELQHLSSILITSFNLY
ncbi:hypothetical protein L2095_07490 [Bacillus zanthoxyli]|nr:hypothetical protein [Bacillus zanthoxyli]